MSNKRVGFQLVLPLVAVTVLLLSSATGYTQQGDHLANANARINFAGKLRMLSQQMAAAACNVNADIDEVKGRKIMTLASAEYNKIINGLEHGNTDLNINGAETDKSVLETLQSLKNRWIPFESAIQNVIEGDATDSDQEFIDESNTALLSSAKNLVRSVLQTYSTQNTALDDSIKTIDVAGRQRMLAQKISKEACQIWSGLDSDDHVKMLQSSMQLFEDSLIQLRDGSENLMQPPTQRIEIRLGLVLDKWLSIKPVLQQAVSRQPVTGKIRKKLSAELNQVLRDMNFIVGFYTVAHKEKGNVEDEGATERVNFSGKLRMLSQRVAAASCHYTAGVEPDFYRSVLTQSQAEFSKILQALEYGDADLRITGVEKRRKTLEALAGVHKEWDGMDVAVSSLLKNENTTENYKSIIEHNLSLLSATQLLASEISGEYSDPSVMTQSSAMLVDVSGRQRMFTQKMDKEACLSWSGQAESRENLSDTIRLFEASLLALRDGVEAAGIRSAPTAEIMYGLEDVWRKWEPLKPELDLAVSGEPVAPAQRARLSMSLDALLSDMNAIVGMYTIYGKTGL